MVNLKFAWRYNIVDLAIPLPIPLLLLNVKYYLASLCFLRSYFMRLTNCLTHKLSRSVLPSLVSEHLFSISTLEIGLCLTIMSANMVLMSAIDSSEKIPCVLSVGVIMLKDDGCSKETDASLS